MRILGWKRVVSLGLVTVFYGSTIPVFASADDNSKSEPPAKRVAAKVDAPAPLTERERWLLDRVEELEKRVADLESKGNPTAASATDASPAGTASANATTNATTSVIAAAAPSIAPGATAANPGPPSNPGASVGPQAMEKGKSGAAQPGKADPFAFADFTWLNGNSRTKDTPYATSFFTPEIRADVDYNYSFNGLPARRSASDAAWCRRRLSLRQCARPADDPVRYVFADDAAQ